MSVDPLLEEVLAALAERGAAEAEVYWKRGRSRRIALSPRGAATVFAQEEGWAVRAGDGRRSFFAAGSGRPDPRGPWPEGDGGTLHLPPAQALPAWEAPADFETPLVGEHEALAILEAIAREIEREIPGARLLAAILEDGASESELASSRQVRAVQRSRLASLRLEAATTQGPRPTVAVLELAEREARRFEPGALARRLADRLFTAAAGAAPERERGEFLLAPPAAARLVAALAPHLAGPQAPARWAHLRDRRGRIGSPAWTLVDDGRYPGGVLEAPADGEGMPTGEVVLIGEGIFEQPLLAWHEAREQHGRASGCARRASYRQLPHRGPTHLYLRPRPEVAPRDLLAQIARGYYLLEATGAARLDLAGDRFALPVCGFAIHQGQPTAPVGGAWLCGSVGALLQGTEAVARDLAFFPLDGMIGAPSVLCTGLEIRRTPG